MGGQRPARHVAFPGNTPGSATADCLRPRPGYPRGIQPNPHYEIIMEWCPYRARNFRYPHPNQLLLSRPAFGLEIADAGTPSFS